MENVEWFGWTADIESLYFGLFVKYLKVLMISKFSDLRLVRLDSSSRLIRL